MTLFNPLRWESTDTTYTAHLKMFVRGIFTNYDTKEQFLGLVPMQSTAIGKAISNAKVQC